MQKTANAIALVAAMLAGAALAQPAQPALVQASPPAPSATAPAAPAATNASLIADLLRIETQKAIEEAKKGEAAAAPQPAASAPLLLAPTPAAGRNKGSAPFNDDIVELLGVYQRESATAADIAINGVVYLLSPGDEILGYQITSVGGNCVHMRDVNKQKLTRCVLSK